MRSIQEQIVLFNKWQFNPDFRVEVSRRYRDLYYLLMENFIDKNICLSISGLRRVGKTTIIFQLINYLLEKKIDSKHIFYFQFSDESTNLEKALTVFFSGFTDEEISRREFYIFLDELQYVKNWQNTLKNYIDQNRKIKFIITGSASVYFRSHIKESLAGRILDFRLDPLSFSEMIRLKEDYKEQYSFDRIMKTDGDKLSAFKKFRFERLPHQKLLGSYLRFGEFPALLSYLDNNEYSRKYLSDGIIDKILHKDIRLFEVEKEEEIFSLYKICCSNMAQMINLKNVAAETGLSYPTIKKYLSVLKKTFLIDSVKNRLKSVRSQVKSLDKVFSASTNLALAMLAIEDPLRPPYLDFKGHIIENFIYNLVRNLGRVYYYNKAGKEIDLVIEAGNNIIPIEVKNTAILKKTDINHLVSFMQKNDIKEGYLVYGGELDKFKKDKREIYLLPYWLF